MLEQRGIRNRQQRPRRPLWRRSRIGITGAVYPGIKPSLEDEQRHNGVQTIVEEYNRYMSCGPCHKIEHSGWRVRTGPQAPKSNISSASAKRLKEVLQNYLQIASINIDLAGGRYLAN